MARTVLVPYEGWTKQFIAGEWRAGRSATTVIVDKNPYDDSEIVRIRGASVDDVDDAYAAAVKAQVAWAALMPRERADVLMRASQVFKERFDEIVALLAREAGATSFWGRQISRHAAICCSEAAGYAQRAAGVILPSLQPGQQSQVYRKPVGVLSLITSWNSPINLTLRALAPALALGNAVVLKPASETPITGGLFHAKVFEEVGLPKGLFSVLVGASTEIAERLTGHDDAAAISFTGSTRIGRSLVAQNANNARMKRIGLELGGNAPLVVLDDADLEQAAKAIVFGRFLHQGQICMSTNRVIVDAAVHDALVDKLVPLIKALPFGDPANPQTVVGPLMTKKAVEGVIEKIEKAKSEGARMLIGGQVAGNVVPPHLFVDVMPEHELSNVEIFGPVLPIIKVSGDAEALDLANNTEFGLASAVFSRDIRRAERFANGIVAGMTNINDQTVQTDIYGPFGGEKNSGFGHFNGEWIIEEFTRPHWITKQVLSRDYPF
ncbi:MAG: aldehyde dehydrogenase family protein [Hyphomicrobiales bacterium]|nr:MAG: aldehyde dehydrogenase family protein [Hyphomicrobiales bacterium]